MVQISGSLRRRLTWTLIGGAAGLAVLVYAFVRSYATEIAQQGQDNVLQASVTSVLDAAIIRDGLIEVDFPYASFSMLETSSDDRVFYAIYQDDRLVSGYPDLPRPAPSPAMETTFQTGSYNETLVRIATGSRTLIGADTRITISVSMAQTQDSLALTLAGIARNVALFGTAFFLLAVALSFWATSTAIGPLQRLTTSVTRRGPQDLSPVTQPIPAEMAPLVGSLNNLMQRLDYSLSQSEDFIAEAAHRVRTPLATVRSHAETMLQKVDREENRTALRSMIRAIDESSRAAGQLLDHAMITFRADHLERQPLFLDALVRDLVMRLTPVADMKDVDLRVHCADPVPCSGDPILVQNAVRNLIDNALKYSPAECSIDITVSASPRPRIEVRDEGPGFPVDEMAGLSSRFARGRNATGIIGSGLGLTIARDVATAHDGTLSLGNHPEGGACVVFSL